MGHIFVTISFLFSNPLLMLISFSTMKFNPAVLWQVSLKNSHPFFAPLSFICGILFLCLNFWIYFYKKKNTFLALLCKFFTRSLICSYYHRFHQNLNEFHVNRLSILSFSYSLEELLSFYFCYCMQGLSFRMLFKAYFRLIDKPKNTIKDLFLY